MPVLKIYEREIGPHHKDCIFYANKLIIADCRYGDYLYVLESRGLVTVQIVDPDTEEIIALVTNANGIDSTDVLINEFNIEDDDLDEDNDDPRIVTSILDSNAFRCKKINNEGGIVDQSRSIHNYDEAIVSFKSFIAKHVGSYVLSTKYYDQQSTMESRIPSLRPEELPI